MNQELLKTYLNYDPETGVFIWIKRSGRISVGERAGSKNSAGYRIISLLGVDWYEHRLAFLYMTGVVPNYVDHSNKIKADNRFINLRSADQSQNIMNSKLSARNTSGYPGVYLVKRNGRWKVMIGKNYGVVHLGYFGTKEEAYQARLKAEREMFGEFAR